MVLINDAAGVGARALAFSDDAFVFAAGISISGNAKANVMFGTRYNDVLSGGGGNDQLYGKAGADHLNGEGGNDVLDAGRDSSHNPPLIEGLWTDVLLGGPGKDVGHIGPHSYFNGKGILGTPADQPMIQDADITVVHQGGPFDTAAAITNRFDAGLDKVVFASDPESFSAIGFLLAGVKKVADGWDAELREVTVLTSNGDKLQIFLDGRFDLPDVHTDDAVWLNDIKAIADEWALA